MHGEAGRPGDAFIDRYMPGASQEERDDAYANLESLIEVLIQIDDRLTREAHNADSRESGGYGRVEEQNV